MLPLAILPMTRMKWLFFTSLVFVVARASLSNSAPIPNSTYAGLAPEVVAQIAAPLIAEAIPRAYERSQDWGRTKTVTTGVRSSGNFFKFDVHSKRKEVNDGVWKRYRVTLIEPEKNLAVRIDNLRKLDSGRYAFALLVTAKVHGWARAIVYERGIHVISLEGEGDTTVRLWLDAEIGVEPVPGKSIVPGIALRPIVTNARLKLDDFQLQRISDVRGPLVHELGDGLRHLIEDKLSGPELTAKINRSIERHRERLEFTPEKLLGRN